MTELRKITFDAVNLPALPDATGHIAVFVTPDGKLSIGARRLNRLTKGAVARAVESERWEKLKTGDVLSLSFPVGLAAEALDLVRLDRRPSVAEARKAGAALARMAGSAGILVLCESQSRAAEVGFGLALRGYAFTDHRTDKGELPEPAVLACSNPDSVAAEAAALMAVAQGVAFTRDLVNEPANVLTTVEFAARLEGLRDLGVEVEVLEEDRLAELGMNALLAVGQGSVTPSKVVVMRWNGGGDEAPLALVGKGVVFDTGGISLKAAAGMESMTMDMGGAGVVAGTMRALALRGAKANVVGLVGLVENMPDAAAMRPGDVVTSMKGDTIEIINTDAEGRLVLSDVMWYAQETYKPSAMIDLATLTGACIVALGHENAAIYSNDDALCAGLLKAAEAEQEGAWRMPMGGAYADLIKTPMADVKNSGGRPAGSITATEFLRRFVKDETPWIHIDIAGVAHVPRDLVLSTKGATGWGVMTLNRLVAERFERD
ncbi:leucyl aminopeptidase [Puniceibacterium sp. IMCC21224]|uniref:leucyl aminopeptidase n=1 Tax=Puniceibacterium sp. IMCC21224 TaxID=1618204 RepID=UPI00064D91C1|nr:leucyl aminopeptidase [Puniceibacterium sp. IMCC21224]KMK67598.1 leucyl aminopeptidase [Puniceibacterium sp. IMCC21224]